MDYNMVGPAIALGLGCTGSAVGSYIAGEAAHAVMSKTDEGHGKYIGMSVAPSSQAIYGFILMLLMKNAILAGSVSALSGIGIGLFAGLSFVFSAVFQGKVCASGMYASLKQPAIYGKCWAAIGILESFALFAFVFSLLLLS